MAKNKLIWNIMAIVSVVIILLVINFAIKMSELNNITKDLNDIEYLNASTQRIVRLALSNSLDSKTVYYINTQTANALNQGTSTLSVLNESYFSDLADDVWKNWSTIFKLLEEDKIDYNALSLAAENHFFKMTELSQALSDYVVELSQTILFIEVTILILFLTMGVTIVKNVLQTHIQLKQSKELAQVALIDMATGLYNRSKCQELFKNNNNLKTKNQPAIIVIDLNDLKKTNDTHGHRIGDELIQAFATALKDACSVHITRPFLGRYGGDEFVVFYEDIESEADITMFLKEVNFLTDKFNADETKFQISYASGYALGLHGDDDEPLSIRELFDIADSAMYQNKKSMKT